MTGFTYRVGSDPRDYCVKERARRVYRSDGRWAWIPENFAMSFADRDLQTALEAVFATPEQIEAFPSRLVEDEPWPVHDALWPREDESP